MNSLKSYSTWEPQSTTHTNAKTKTEVCESKKKDAKNIRKDIYQEYQAYHKAKQEKLQERMLQLNFIIKNAAEISDIMEEKET
jgi:hypothetical protein